MQQFSGFNDFEAEKHEYDTVLKVCRNEIRRADDDGRPLVRAPDEGQRSEVWMMREAVWGVLAIQQCRPGVPRSERGS